MGTFHMEKIARIRNGHFHQEQLGAMWLLLLLLVMVCLGQSWFCQGYHWRFSGPWESTVECCDCCYQYIWSTVTSKEVLSPVTIRKWKMSEYIFQLLELSDKHYGHGEQCPSAHETFCTQARVAVYFNSWECSNIQAETCFGISSGNSILDCITVWAMAWYVFHATIVWE